MLKRLRDGLSISSIDFINHLRLIYEMQVIYIFVGLRISWMKL
ncbi:unnamed protein product [Acidithrix sp. C25]|nr:unnamed protein product [Acidithrix sp. C25]